MVFGCPPPASVKGSLSDCSADPSLSPFDLLLGRNKHSQAEIVSLCFAALQPVIFCHRHVQIHQKKNYMFVVPIMVQCNVWGKERGGELGGRGGYRMCAISGQLCLHCSMSAGDDFTVASCHMTMTPLTPMSDAASDLGLDRVDDFTQMLASLRQQKTSASRT